MNTLTNILFRTGVILTIFDIVISIIIGIIFKSSLAVLISMLVLAILGFCYYKITNLRMEAIIKERK